jgi:glycine cleavage system H protein
VPDKGRVLAAGEACAVVESVKAASDVYCPVAGEVTAANTELAHAPELINQDAFGRGWLLRLRPTAGGAGTLLSPSEYAGLLLAEGGS